MSDAPLSLIARWEAPPLLDIRASILAGGPLSDAPRDQHGHIDLRGIDLRGLVSDRFVLEYGALDFARLDRSRLDGAKIVCSSARFLSAMEVDWRKATLRDNDFSYGNFTSAVLSESALKRSCLFGTIFAVADLRATDMHGVQLRGCDLENALIAGANFDRDDRRRSTRDDDIERFPALREGRRHYFSFLSLRHPGSVRSAEGIAWGHQSGLEVAIHAAFTAGWGWRDQLVGAALALFGADRLRKPHIIFEPLWNAIGKSWASPQLAVTAYLLDPDFIRRAELIVTSSPNTKASEALEFLLSGRETTSQGARIAQYWLDGARKYGNPKARASWVR